METSSETSLENCLITFVKISVEVSVQTFLDIFVEITVVSPVEVSVKIRNSATMRCKIRRWLMNLVTKTWKELLSSSKTNVRRAKRLEILSPGGASSY